MRSLYSKILFSNTIYLFILLIAGISFYLFETYIIEGFTIYFLIFYLAAIFSGAIYFSYSLAKSVSSHIHLIEIKTKEINAGDFGLALTVPDIKELAELSSSINAMSKRLRHQFSDLNFEKEKFNSLLQNLREGVFAIDIHGKILFQNNSIPKDLIPCNSQHRKIEDAIKNHKFLNFIKEHFSKGTDGKLNIEISKSYYSIRLYTLKSNEKVQMFIGVILDKTEERARQMIREEFVQSASHELKTPITSIKGYTETLYSRLNLPTDSVERKFLDAILRNTDRMIRIVEDMLTISKLESSNSSFQPEQCKIIDIINDLRYTIEGVTGPKKQKFIIDVPDSLTLFADPVLMEHMLLNLIQNASIYSPPSTEIKINATPEFNKITINVFDQGVGINEKEIPRIFERFYRVDKNRSRKEGGTGLGLSIVKHIVKLHKGEIRVTSNTENKGQGSIFSVHLPVINKIEDFKSGENGD